MHSAWRWLLVLIILSAPLGFHLFDMDNWLSIDLLQQHSLWLGRWVNTHYVLSIVIYMLVYLLVVLLMLPIEFILMLLSGYFYGFWVGTVYVISVLMLAGILQYYLVRSVLGEMMSRVGARWVQALRGELNKNVFLSILVLRLLPIFPYWMINIVAALLNLPIRAYIWLTFIGVIPSSMVYVWLGRELEAALDQAHPIGWSFWLQPTVLFPLGLWSSLALIAWIYHRWINCNGACPLQSFA